MTEAIKKGAALNQLSPSEVVQGLLVAETLDEVVRERWRELSQSGKCTPYQTLEWYEAWLSTAGAAGNETPFIIQCFDSHRRLVLLVPLTVSKRAGFVTCRFAGRKHANFNFPILRSDITLSAETVRYVFARLAAATPKVDLLHLEALPPEWDGAPNPFLHLSHRTHPAFASVLSLIGTDAQAVASTRTRRRPRSADRKLAKMGLLFRRACTTLEVDAGLASFFRQKAVWFDERGLPDSFAQSGIRDFFHILFRSPHSNAELHILEIDNHIVAVAGLLVQARRASLMFISHDSASEFASFSPGTRLTRYLIQHLRDREFNELDFGLGEAAYKTALGAHTSAMYVVLHPMTAKGRILAHLKDAERFAKAFIKNSPKLFALALSLRRKWKSALQSRTEM